MFLFRLKQTYVLQSFLLVYLFLQIGCDTQKESDTTGVLTDSVSLATTNIIDSSVINQHPDTLVQAVNVNSSDSANTTTTVKVEKKTEVKTTIVSTTPAPTTTTTTVVTKPVTTPVVNNPEPVKPAPVTQPTPVVITPPVVINPSPVQGGWIVPGNYQSMVSPYPNDKESIELGKSMYGMHCKSCHGTKGEGNGPKSTTIDTKMRSFLSAGFKAQNQGEVYYKSMVGRKDMPRFEKKIADKEEQWAIVHYIMSL